MADDYFLNNGYHDVPEERWDKKCKLCSNKAIYYSVHFKKHLCMKCRIKLYAEEGINI